MKTPSHTPGPWKASDIGYGINIEPDIAWIGFGSAHTTAVHRANARLIAAAPDLLEIAETFIRFGFLSGVNPEIGSSDPVSNLLALAEAAIAKATGQPTAPES